VAEDLIYSVLPAAQVEEASGWRGPDELVPLLLILLSQAANCDAPWVSRSEG
jgi:hypothetical protein